MHVIVERKLLKGIFKECVKKEKYANHEGTHCTKKSTSRKMRFFCYLSDIKHRINGIVFHEMIISYDLCYRKT